MSSSVYVGNLPPEVRTKDISDVFRCAGKILAVAITIPIGHERPRPFAFIRFRDSRDAEKAVELMHGFMYKGFRLRVAFPQRLSRRGVSQRTGYVTDVLRTNYRVLVTGLPPTATWQDLKDHVRRSVRVCFVELYNEGIGVVEFLSSEDMKYAVRKYDRTEFVSTEGEKSYIRLKEESRSAEYRRSRSRSKCYSPSYRRGRESRSNSYRRCDDNVRSSSSDRSRFRSRSPPRGGIRRSRGGIKSPSYRRGRESTSSNSCWRCDGNVHSWISDRSRFRSRSPPRGGIRHSRDRINSPSYRRGRESSSNSSLRHHRRVRSSTADRSKSKSRSANDRR